MPGFGPISRRDLIRYFRQLGFDGPFPGGNHQYMAKAGLRIRIPNPHTGAIDPSLLAKILAQAAVSRDEWESL